MKTSRLFIFISVFFISCYSSMNEEETIKAWLVDAKWSLQPEKNEVNIYFTGRIVNNTTDTLFLAFKNKYSYSFENSMDDSYFYIIPFRNDTFYLKQSTGKYWINPKDSTPVRLMQKISFKDNSWIKDYKTVLDTITVYYHYSGKGDYRKINHMKFEYANSFKIDSLPDNSYMEYVFMLEEWLE